MTSAASLGDDYDISISWGHAHGSNCQLAVATWMPGFSHGLCPSGNSLSSLQSPTSRPQGSHSVCLCLFPAKELARVITSCPRPRPTSSSLSKASKLSPPTHPPQGGHGDCPKAEALRHSPPQSVSMVPSGLENKVQALWPAHTLCDRSRRLSSPPLPGHSSSPRMLQAAARMYQDVSHPFVLF